MTQVKADVHVAAKSVPGDRQLRPLALSHVTEPLKHDDACPVYNNLRPRVCLFGVPADALDLESTVDAVLRMITCGALHQHVCLNAAKVVELQGRPDLAEVIAQCELISVDGQAVVWASRLLGQPVPERVAGVDLFERLLAVAATEGHGVFLLGATEEVVADCARLAALRHPGLKVAGARSGYWEPVDELQVVNEVARSGASMLFVALPSPRKEHFLSRHGEAMRVPFRMGVGGSFDVYAGVTRRAPVLMQRAGMEWLYRLLQEPRRMFKRYLVGNSAFVLLTIRQLRRGR